MRALIQRVHQARVEVDNETVGQCGRGLLVLLGCGEGDTDEDLDYVFEKVINLRIFEDEAGKMNLSLLDIGGELLVVSQFTLYADTRRGRRPSFGDAMKPEPAEAMYEAFVARARARGITTGTGQFGAMMNVSLTNAGPVTIMIDSRAR
ncbi:D-tyrosyl-tRNA(Tyr) deacylase [Lujinxingia sediminis]|uniref:D-aminoacyl-tRNA deacylase n=1 Tax=Lujinxingia sediminis TaxID=2480984 RepID=A0ABY0CU03_9DELT|nr:D-aminoacyl-tRNA deacylase [Lujinxingia sediminis]RVU45793.1 D-tyrosyl-tRNA(Tyr) deacylase [Lujinxingia sediminis]